LYRSFTGVDPSLAAVGPWLPRLADGEPYRDLATAVATSTNADRRTAADLALRLLHRNGAANELSAWAGLVHAAGPDATAVRFLSSAEAYSRTGGTPAGWVDATYQDLMGRPADGGGLTYWTTRLGTGASREQVAAGLWWSAGAVRSRISALYLQIFNRPADGAGLAYWSGRLPALGTRGVAIELAAGPAGWARSQVVFGAAATTQPAACAPRLRWIPPGGSIVRDLRPLANWGPKLVALTFDDGPDPRWTPQILSVLAKHDVKATFFVVGFQVRAHPELVRQEVAAGHHVATHTVDHTNLLTLGAAAQQRQIVDSRRQIEAIAGAGSVRCFRPPYGNHNATTDRIAREQGLATILWSRDGRDWARPGVDTIVAGNLSTRYDGGRAVILLHDSGTDRTQTVAALDRLIPTLKAQGYRFVQIC
ncbi:MAG: polysaccharide deacetylase family protein, partial [Aquihabitans sp.]